MSSKNLLLEKPYKEDFDYMLYTNGILASHCVTPTHLAFFEKDVHKSSAAECKGIGKNSFSEEHHTPLSSNSTYREHHDIQKKLSDLEATDETKNVAKEKILFKNKCKFQIMEENGNVEQKLFFKEKTQQSENELLKEGTKILLNEKNSDCSNQSDDEVQNETKYLSNNTNQNYYYRESLLREIYTCFLAVELVYVLNNFIFNNSPAGVITLLIFICAIFAHLDRRSGSYILIGILSLFMGIVISVAINKELDGFNLYFSNSLLSAISIFHILASFFFSFLSFFLAFCRIQWGSFTSHIKFVDKDSETNEERSNEELKKNVTKEVTLTQFCDSFDSYNRERRRKLSEDKNQKFDEGSTDIDKKASDRNGEGRNFQS